MKMRFEFKRYALPLKQAVRTAHGVWAVREGVILRVTDEAGVVRLGEVAPIAWFGTASVDEVVAMCEKLNGEVTEEILSGLEEKLGCLVAGFRAAAAPQGDGSEVMGDRRNAYLPVAGLLPAGRAAMRRVEELGEAGFRVFKWKVGVEDVADELGMLDDLIARMPSGGKLRLDANGAWDRRQAERWLERCAERPVEFVEQPCAAAPGEGRGARGDGAEGRKAMDLLMGLAGAFPTPIALDESVVGGRDVDVWLDAGWPGWLVLKVSLIENLDTVLTKVKKAGTPVVFSSTLETAVGAKAALRMALAWGGEPRALGFGVWPLFQDRRMDGPWAAPFIRAEDVERIDTETVWNALS